MNQYTQAPCVASTSVRPSIDRPYRVNNAQWGSVSTKKKAEIKARLESRDGFNCHYCQIPFVHLSELVLDENDSFVIPEGVATACIDHILPLSMGGTNALENMVLACDSCNSLKGQKAYDVFMAEIGGDSE